MTNEEMFYKGQPIHFNIPEGVKAPIYVISDSHGKILIDAAPYLFKSSQTDVEDVSISKTAYAIGGEDKRFYLTKSLLNIPQGEQVIVSFGEIDCRHHVPKWAKIKNKTIEQIVDEVIERYTTKCVEVLMEIFKVIVMGAYVCPDDHNHPENSYEDIYEAKKLFNQKIEQYCIEKEIIYIPLYKVALENGWDTARLEELYFSDGSHLNACMIPVILETLSSHE